MINKQLKKEIYFIVSGMIAILAIIVPVDAYVFQETETVYVLAQEPLPAPSPKPTATPIPKPMTVEEEIETVFGEVSDQAKVVAFCESSLNPKAKSLRSSAKGLFQIIDGTWKQFKCKGDPYTSIDNIKCAKKIYDYYNAWSTRGGWRASYWCHKQK